MFGTPVVWLGPAFGEVVGADPYDDSTDATYVRAINRAHLTTQPGDGFGRIAAPVGTASFAEIPTVTVRASATGTNVLAARVLMNFNSIDDPQALVGSILNLSAGTSESFVDLEVDGVIRDIPVAVYDWETELPASLEQINNYFAAGGTLDVAASFRGTTGGSGPFEVDVRVYRITFGETTVFRRVFPRDDGLSGGAPRTTPNSIGVQGRRRTSGGYL